jgi:23S rRNA pseudouridine1911/1915/1917 synthase
MWVVAGGCTNETHSSSTNEKPGASRRRQTPTVKPPSSIHQHRSLRSTHVNVLFEDSEIIVVEKPAGLLTIATDKEKRRTVYAFLFEHVKRKPRPEKLFIVHRLDREASGLLVFAKSEAAKYYLQQQFKEHCAGRAYMAVTEHRMTQDQCTIRSYLAENVIHRCYSTRDGRKGKLAITHVKVLKRSSRRTLVEVRLETGRKHQIRAHLSEKGYPIVGDHAYGSASNPIRHLALHAVKLVFKHPHTGKLMEFVSPPPKSFASLV